MNEWDKQSKLFGIFLATESPYLHKEWLQVFIEGGKLQEENNQLKKLVQSDEALDKNLMKEKLDTVRRWLKHHRRIPADSEDWDIMLGVLGDE